MTTSESQVPDPERSVQEFEGKRDLYEKLKNVVVRDLTEALRDRGLDKQVHGPVQSRVKEIDSFRGKITSRGYKKPLVETRDLLGVRVVCLYPSVLQDIDTLIRQTFNVVQYEDKGKNSEPEVWRYTSVHYDCTLPESSSGRNYDDVKGLVFEIQVRTILQDAWATVEHQLGYKSEKRIPDELKREFSALAGLFHVADERFQFIADQIKAMDRSKAIAKQLAPLYLAAIEASDDPSVEDPASTDPAVEKLGSGPDAVINRGSLKVLLRGMYPERASEKNLDYTRFVQDLNAEGIVTLGALGRALIRGDRAARESERSSGSLSRVEFARWAALGTNPKLRSGGRQRRTRRRRTTADDPGSTKNSPANFNDSAIVRKASLHVDKALLDLRRDGVLTPFVIVDSPVEMMYVSLPELSEDDFWRAASTDVPAIIILYEVTEMVLVTVIEDGQACGGDRECVAVAHWGPHGRSLSVATLSRRGAKPPVLGRWRGSDARTERIDAVGDGFRHGTELAQQLRESSSHSDAELLEQINLIRITALAEDTDVLPLTVAALRRRRWLT